MDAGARPSVWVMLFARTGLFAGWQAVVAGVAALLGVAAPWAASVGWWPVVATATNLVCIAALIRLFAGEGQRYRDLFRIERATLGQDLAVVAGLSLAMGVAAVAPNIALTMILFDDPERPVEIMFQPLPWSAVAVSLVAFPLTIALAEIPTYFGYVMPRLEAQIGRTAAVVLTALLLSAQHVALPLVFEARFVVWRLLMFLPLALLLAVALRWRPRLLPYLALVHGLLDLSAAWMVLDAARQAG